MSTTIIEIDLPRRDMALLLPRSTSDHIVHDVLRAEGWTIRDPGLLRYQITLDDSPDKITISIQQPFKALVSGKWATDHRPSTIRFSIEMLELSFNVDSPCPLLPTSSLSSAAQRALWHSGSADSFGNQADTPLRSAIPPIDPPLRLPQPRTRESRSIDLG